MATCNIERAACLVAPSDGDSIELNIMKQNVLEDPNDQGEMEGAAIPCQMQIMGSDGQKKPIPAPPTPLSPMDLDKLRIQDAGPGEAVKLPGVPRVCKPSKTTWFMTYPDESAWETYCVFSPESSNGSLTYIIAPQIAPELGAARIQTLVPCVSLDQVLFFWPISQVSEQGNSWAESARVIAGEAMKEWRRIAANSVAKAYDAWKPSRPRDPAVFPSPEEIKKSLAKAFDGKIITSLDHPEAAKLLMA